MHKDDKRTEAGDKHSESLDDTARFVMPLTI